MARRTPVLVLAATAVAALALATPPDTAATAAPPTQGYSMWTQTFVDASRPTLTTSRVVSRERKLVTTIARPEGRGPFPLVELSHGFGGSPAKLTHLMAVWARAGYVVVAPAFPETNTNASAAGPATRPDFVMQPGDVEFVLNRVLALNQRRGDRLFRAIDPRHIGAAGLSLGGATDYTVVYDRCCRDPRITALEILDGVDRSLATSPDSGPPVTIDGHVPLLIVHSDSDGDVVYSTAVDAFAAAAPPAWFVTLHGAGHTTQYENGVTPYTSLSGRITLDFWDATLKEQSASYGKLTRDATVTGRASIEAKP